MAFSGWSTSNAGNNSTLGINIGENCPPSNVNNGMREIMAQLRTAISVTFDPVLSASSLADARSVLGVQAAGNKLSSLSGLAGGANKLPYFTGADAMAQTDMTALGRTLLAAATLTTLAQDSGLVALDAADLSVNGYAKFRIGNSGLFTVQWGSATANGNGATTITYPTAFSSFSRAIVSGANQTQNAQDNNPGVTACGTTNFTIYSAVDSPLTVFWIAVGA